MSSSTHTTMVEEAANSQRCAIPGADLRKSPFRLSDIWKAPLHDFPIRDEILCQFLPLSPEMDVLEIGPGSGFTAFWLSRLAHTLTLVDVSVESLDALGKQFRHSPNLRCICADATCPGLVAQLKQHFDVAFGLDVFEYFLDPANCLRNLAEVLRDRGELFLTYPNVAPPLGDGVTYVSEYAELQQLLEQAGFRSWEIFAVRLRPYPAWVYRVLHEWPLRAYRRLRKRSRLARPLVYDATWAFQQRKKLSRFRSPLHLFWLVLGAVMRFGGDVFTREPATTKILGRQLVIRAWK
jgi:SAM-dependent methyltransferase